MSLRSALAATVVLTAAAGPTHAQIARVFVSVNGNDANTCSNIATPCRTLGGGVAQVDAGGEVIVIDSGSYAGANILKPVKINVAAGAVAFSGLSITVNPGPSGTVVLRGLTLKAATAGSGNGILHQSGTLFVENTVVDGWQQGLHSVSGADKLFVKGSIFRNQAAHGLRVETATIAVDNSFFENNSNIGLFVNSSKGRVTNSVMSGNNFGAAVDTAGADVTFQRCEFSDNADSGVYAIAAIVRVSGSTVTRNATGLKNNGAGATLESYGNNAVRGNTTETSGAITPVPLQ